MRRSDHPIGQAVSHSRMKQEVQIFWLVKSDTVLPMARHCCDIYSKGAVLCECNDAEMFITFV